MLIPRGLLALRNVAATDKTRYAMHGVAFERKGELARASATDGKMLALVSWRDQKTTDVDAAERFGLPANENGKLFVLVPSEALARADKSMPRDKATKARRPVTQFLALDENAEHAEHALKLATLDGALSPMVATTPQVKGHFPPIDDVIPSEGKGIRITFDAEYLLRLVETLSCVGESFDRRKSTAVTLEMSGPDAPISVRVGARGSAFDARGILMPVRHGGDEGADNVAAWLRAITPPAPAVETPAPVPAIETPAPLAEDPDAGSPGTHVTAECRACGKFGLVRTHVRLHDSCSDSTTPAVEKPARVKRPRKPAQVACATCGVKLEAPTVLGLCSSCEDSRRFETTLALASDSRETLRSCDVDRVMREAHEQGAGFLERFRSWLAGALGEYRPNTLARIAAWPNEPMRSCERCKLPMVEVYAAEDVCSSCRNAVMLAARAVETPAPAPVVLEIREPRTGVVETKVFEAGSVEPVAPAPTWKYATPTGEPLRIVVAPAPETFDECCEYSTATRGAIHAFDCALRTKRAS